MTIITTVITKNCTVHASDSFLTTKTGQVVERKKSKIIKLERWAGAISYWGLANNIGVRRQQTSSWLQERAKEAYNFKSPEKFAQYLGHELNKAISNLSKKSKGIGIHLTAYEKAKNDLYVPELFRISNYKDWTDEIINNGLVHCSRETYQNIFAPQSINYRKEHRKEKYRLKVHHFLNQQNRIFIFNNGDVEMFNPILSCILSSLKTLKQRDFIRESDDLLTIRDLARTPIEIVANIQDRFSPRGKRLVGGNIHYMVVTKEGMYDAGFLSPQEYSGKILIDACNPRDQS